MNRTAARRPYFLARYLADNGFQVSVLTETSPRENGWQADLSNIRMIRRPFTKRPIGLNIAQKIALPVFWNLYGTRFSRIARLIADLILPLNIDRRLDVDVPNIAEEGGPHDIIIATGPFWSTVEFGYHFKRYWKCTYLVDYRDPWSVKIPEVGLRLLTWYGNGLIGRWRVRRMLELERRYSGSADGLTGVTPLVLKNALRVIGNKPSATIFNGHLLHKKISKVTQKELRKFTLIYTGQVYEEQEWEIVARAMTLIEREEPFLANDLDLVLVGATTAHGRTMDRINEMCRRSPMVRTVDRLDREQVLDLQMRSDLLLHVGFKNIRGVLPLKFIEYMHSGVPIVQVSSGHDIQEEALELTRTGVVVKDSVSLIDLLLQYHALWSLGQPIPYDPNLSRLAEFTWDHQMRKWTEFMLVVHEQRQRRDHEN